jgi:N utilization substance protein B
MKRERRRVRRLAIEILYEIDCVSHPAEEVIERRLEANPNLSQDSIDFLNEIVIQTITVKDQLDQIIANYAPEWPVEELAILDRNILRIATWEMIFSQSTATKIAINEAVELAKRYGADNAPRFINGVLGGIATKESEIRQQFLPI